MSRRRTRWRSYLLLARVSNLPTVWTNVLAGMAAEAAVPAAGSWIQIAAAASLFYTGGMFLNDAFDAPFDSQARPERPNPTATSAHGSVVAGPLPRRRRGAARRQWPHPYAGPAARRCHRPLRFLAQAQPGGSARHGRLPRLVYLIAAAALGGPSTAALAGAAIITAYVVGLTVVAKLSDPAARWRVPLLLAGISLVDAAFIGWTTGSLPLVAAAVSVFRSRCLSSGGSR